MKIYIYRILNDAKVSATLADFKSGLFYKSPSGIIQTIFIDFIAKERGTDSLAVASFMDEVIHECNSICLEGYVHFSKRIVWK